MRWIVFTYLLGISGLLAGAPSEVALQLLRDLGEKEDQAKVLEKLAISPFCGPEKRGMIDDFWKSKASWAKAGNYAFSAVGEQVDDDLAAVLIGAKSPNGPDSVAIVSLGMVRRDGDWMVAPVAGTFENTGLGFGAELKARVRKLEDWMALERIGGVDKLKAEELERFRKEMDGVIPEDVLKLEDPEDVLNHFVKCAEEGNADALLVWQGILERDQLPDRNWDRCIRITRKGIKNEDARSVWRLLTSKKVMKVIVEGQGDTEEADYLLSFLSSYDTAPSSNNLNPVRFNMTMTKKGWRIHLPAFFEYADEDDRVFRTARNRDFDWEDRRGAREMGYVFEAENEKLRSPDPESLLTALIGDLGKEGLVPFLQRHYREVERVEDEEADDDDEAEENILPLGGNGGNDEIDDRRMGRYEEAVKWWGGTLKNQKTLTATVAKLYKDEKLALGILSLDNGAGGWEPTYQTVWMAKEEDGWMILPGLKTPMLNSIQPALVEVQKKFADQFLKDKKIMEEKFLADVLKVVVLDGGEGKAASSEEAVALAKEWRTLAGKGGMLELLEKSAVRKLPENPVEFLKDVVAVRNGAKTATVPDQIIGSKVEARFHGVSMMVDDRNGVERACPLLIVTPTKNGFRVLVDVELPLETNKGVKLLNSARMDDLKKEMNEEDFAAIEKLRNWHQEISRPVWEKWEKNKSETGK